MPRTNKKTAGKPNPILALLCAWGVPGLGHVYLGRKVRGLVILLTIGVLFWSGVAVGGVMTVDSLYERWWFTAQMFTGVHGVAGWYRQNRVYDRLAADPEVGALGPGTPGQIATQQLVVDKALARDGLALVQPTDTVARAYSGVAGLLNLMCMFDALILATLGVRGEPAPQPAEPPPGKEGGE